MQLRPDSVNPLASDVLPWFVTPPGGTDVLFVITTIVVIMATVLLGVLFFWLHSLPERMGHKKLQFEVVAVLGLISLFTHENIFWILGLLLAVIDLPDLVNPLRRIARATEKIADTSSENSPQPLHNSAVPTKRSDDSRRVELTRDA